MPLSLLSKILRYRPRHKKYDNDRRSYPKRAVEVGIAFHDVQEVLAGVEGAADAVEEGRGVDVEELLVEGYAPEVAFAAAGGGIWGVAGGRGVVEEGLLVGGEVLVAAVGGGVEIFGGCISECIDR